MFHLSLLTMKHRVFCLPTKRLNNPFNKQHRFLYNIDLTHQFFPWWNNSKINIKDLGKAQTNTLTSFCIGVGRAESLLCVIGKRKIKLFWHIAKIIPHHDNAIQLAHQPFTSEQQENFWEVYRLRQQLLTAVHSQYTHWCQTHSLLVVYIPAEHQVQSECSQIPVRASIPKISHV